MEIRWWSTASLMTYAWLCRPCLHRGLRPIVNDSSKELQAELPTQALICSWEAWCASCGDRAYRIGQWGIFVTTRTRFEHFLNKTLQYSFIELNCCHEETSTRYQSRVLHLCACGCGLPSHLFLGEVHATCFLPDRACYLTNHGLIKFQR